MSQRLVTNCCYPTLGISLVCMGALSLPLAAGMAPILSWSGVVACLIAGISSMFALRKHNIRQAEKLDQFTTDICKIQPQQFAGNIDDLLPLLDGNNAEDEPLLRLREFMVSVGSAYQLAETDRAKAEVRCRSAVSAGSQLRDIVHGLSEPVMAVNQYDELVLANQSAAELFHFDTDDFEKQAIDSLLECRELIDLLSETRSHRGVSRRTAEVSVVNDDDSARWFNATAETVAKSPEVSGSQEQGAVIVLRDITDRKDIQRRHAEFVSSVSHEMKTPLASIKAYVELLADGDAEDEETREEFLNVINGQADRLRRLIDNLLNIARIEAGVVNVKKEDQSLNEILEEAFQVVQPSAEMKQIELVSDLSPLYLGTFVDRDMILQAAINLLSNAVKYTPEHGTVTLRSRTSDGSVEFEVQDTGVGLSPEDAERVFEKFYRVKKDQNMAPGTGLGLPLAKHIVEDVHGGTLTVQSFEGSGSTFRISLPTNRQT